MSQATICRLIKQTPTIGELRICRTLDGDTAENLGVYLVLEQLEQEDHNKCPYWRCLVLCDDSHNLGLVEPEHSGSLVELSVTWLVKWTEPYEG